MTEKLRADNIRLWTKLHDDRAAPMKRWLKALIKWWRKIEGWYGGYN